MSTTKNKPSLFATHRDQPLITYDEHNQSEPWKNTVAKELNLLLDRVQYHREVGRNESDLALEQAAVSLTSRVAEFEGIEPTPATPSKPTADYTLEDALNLGKELRNAGAQDDSPITANEALAQIQSYIRNCMDWPTARLAKKLLLAEIAQHNQIEDSRR